MNQEKMKNMAESCCSEQMAGGCPCSSMIKGHKTGFVLFAGAAALLFLAANAALVLGVIAFFRTF
jgi:hypothetical protein